MQVRQTLTPETVGSRAVVGVVCYVRLVCRQEGKGYTGAVMRCFHVRPVKLDLSGSAGVQDYGMSAKTTAPGRQCETFKVPDSASGLAARSGFAASVAAVALVAAMS
jgi:hypothetical protein